MDSAEAERLSEVLRTQEARLNRQEEFQTAMAANMGQISSQIQELLGQLCRQSPAPPTPPSPASPEIPVHSGGASCKLAPPTQYTDKPGLCRTFLIDCSIHFELMPQAFATKQAKVAFMISHLTGLWPAQNGAETQPYARLSQGFRRHKQKLLILFVPVGRRPRNSAP